MKSPYVIYVYDIFKYAFIFKHTYSKVFSLSNEKSQNKRNKKFPHKQLDKLIKINSITYLDFFYISICVKYLT